MTSDNARLGSCPPTFFFDFENCRHLPHGLFHNYMKVCQILSYDKLHEDFVGTVKQLRKLMHQVTVFDFFIVTEALAADGSILDECHYESETYPKSYDDWCARLTVEDIAPDTDSMDITSEEPQPKKVCQAVGKEGATASVSTAPEPKLWAEVAKAKPAPAAEAAAKVSSTKTKTKQEKTKVSRPKGPPVKPAQVRASDASAPSLLEKASAALTPVEEGFRKTYGSLPSKEVRQLEFFRKIPILRKNDAEKVTACAKRGERFSHPRLRQHGRTADPADWQRVYGVLTQIYQPCKLVYVKKVEPTDFDVEQCVKWKTLPYRVVTTDREFWEKASAKEKLNGESWAESMED